MAEQLHRLCDPWVEHYRGDLEHDRNDLAGLPEEVPFIVVARTHGTDLVILRPASDPHFPPPGETAPLCFGRAGREKIADAVLAVLEHNQREHRATPRRWFASRGKGVVRRTEPEAALKEARAWREGLQREWDRERKRPHRGS
ncbi:hypothetical protein [Phycisphaera mikurensis]|uniref:Uncharacterized protein n=1 Tax=Phycisphaera mikurensis (strain NBRC 102666 / KCTC 22515 / FYK2301M01) TaxID=1142394 RepID=I0IJH7_PHYMF|nr:hypothetical protein [Phycisphaera mikurensis]BAM05415.1 hypothetical protein PSMK_p00530 [Phycisphaera mikurensis NBRC 102666]